MLQRHNDGAMVVRRWCSDSGSIRVVKEKEKRRKREE